MSFLIWIAGIFLIPIVLLIVFDGDDEVTAIIGVPIFFIFSIFILSSDLKFENEKEYSGYGIGTFIVDTIPYVLPIGAVTKVGGIGGATKSITRVGNTYN